MKLALISPRYGAEIDRGPERACRLFAEQLCRRHDVDVVTTCARDAGTWNNEYAEGSDRVRGVLVRRFATAPGRDLHGFRQLTERLHTRAHSRADELEWVRRLGPWSPGLLEFIKRHHRNFDALVFFSYKHATTVHGIIVAPERSILFPWLRFEPSLRFGVCQDTLRSAAAVGYASNAERELFRLHAGATAAPREELLGVGIDGPAEHGYPRPIQSDQQEDNGDEDGGTETPDQEPPLHLTGRGMPFRRRQRLYGRFVLHGGRVEPDNGCEELIEYFDAYASMDNSTSLVLMGVKMMMLPEEPYLRLAGVLPERERMLAFEAADVVVVPEPDDLLGDRVLESFAVGTPILATARNPTAVEHCCRANGGLYYANREEFVDALRLLMMDDRLRARLGRNGHKYAHQYFRWDAVLGRFERLVPTLRA